MSVLNFPRPGTSKKKSRVHVPRLHPCKSQAARFGQNHEVLQMTTALRIEPTASPMSPPIVPPSKRRPRRAKPAVQALRDALTKPRLCAEFRCNCAECTRIQEVTTISCTTCGHQGRAATWHCSCDTGRQELIERLTGLHSEITTGDLREWIDYSVWPMERVERELAAAVADAEATKGLLCRSGAKEGVDCMHGQAFCDVCFGADRAHNPEEAWEIVRDIRAASEHLLSRFTAILERPNTEWYGENPTVCSCDECEVVRVAGIACRVCGFRGKPVVQACECRAIRSSNIRFNNTEIAKIRAGKQEDRDLAYYEGALANTLSWPDCDCRHGSSIRCPHGLTGCPCCGDRGDAFKGPNGGEYALRLATDLHELLVGKPIRLTRTRSAKTVA